jgi:hypothetical protein
MQKNSLENLRSASEEIARHLRNQSILLQFSPEAFVFLVVV